jgi:dihydrodipicolinate synthase/N-acetylneuraminate lyase
MGADIARRVERAGAECVLVLPPYYSNAPEEGLFQFYETIGRATPLPLMI